MNSNIRSRDQLSEGLRRMLGESLALLGLEGEVVTLCVDAGLQIGVRLPARDLRLFTGEDGRTWRAFGEILTVIGRRHQVELTLAIVDPPGSTWAFDVPTSTPRCRVKTASSSSARD